MIIYLESKTNPKETVLHEVHKISVEDAANSHGYYNVIADDNIVLLSNVKKEVTDFVMKKFVESLSKKDVVLRIPNIEKIGE